MPGSTDISPRRKSRNSKPGVGKSKSKAKAKCKSESSDDDVFAFKSALSIAVRKRFWLVLDSTAELQRLLDSFSMHKILLPLLDIYEVNECKTAISFSPAPEIESLCGPTKESLKEVNDTTDKILNKLCLEYTVQKVLMILGTDPNSPSTPANLLRVVAPFDPTSFDYGSGNIAWIGFEDDSKESLITVRDALVSSPLFSTCSLAGGSLDIAGGLYDHILLQIASYGKAVADSEIKQTGDDLRVLTLINGKLGEAKRAISGFDEASNTEETDAIVNLLLATRLDLESIYKNIDPIPDQLVLAGCPTGRCGGGAYSSCKSSRYSTKNRCGSKKYRKSKSCGSKKSQKYCRDKCDSSSSSRCASSCSRRRRRC